MKKTVILLLSLLMVACATTSLLNVQSQPIPALADGRQPSLNEVERDILNAVKKRGWRAHVVKPGLIEAKITVRSHMAEVSIPYTTKSYGIQYKNSVNLDYDGDSIHRNYNKWVVKLSQSIQNELSF